MKTDPTQTRFDEFFVAATGHASPFEYQRRLAEGDPPSAAAHSTRDQRSSTSACRSRLIHVPTGLGKTAAVVLAWLWNRLLTRNAQCGTRNAAWPRRLVYCLPMRTLVEQTRDNAQRWLANLWQHREALGLDAPETEELLWLAGDGTPAHPAHSPVVLMGGEELNNARREWDIYPEKPAILIGTQDMLLSRALNRGYAAGRARWPKDFALLNNDCLWVFDEVQLMGSGFATSLHLQAWRERLQLRRSPAGFAETVENPVSRPVFSWWMSATLIPDWLERAVDFRSEAGRLWKSCEAETQKLWQEDAALGTELDLLLRQTRKELRTSAIAELKVGRDGRPLDVDDYIAKVAKKVVEELAKPSTRPCLVILNTVDRAVRLHRELTGGDKPKVNLDQSLLLHSRFRAKERGAWLDQLKGKTARPRLIVATQVVEAGLDLSGDPLFTESCPWPSFIQRLGRAARGLDRDRDGAATAQVARIFWMDVTDVPSPYEPNEVQLFADEINQLGCSANLATLKQHADGLKNYAARRRRLFPYEPRFVPRDKDLFDLFDTTPDLTGADVDISRFIRDADELDVQVFWRDCDALKREDPPKSWRPEHAELCPVPVGGETGFRQFLLKKPRGHIWRWDYRDGWTRLTDADAERVYPGQIFLLEATCGGYRTDIGWTGDEDDCPWRNQPDLLGPWKSRGASESPGGEESDNTDESDGLSETGMAGQWRDILTHTREVCSELEALLHDTALVASLGDTTARILRLAARVHDWGKAHPAFQAKLKTEMPNAQAKQLADGLAAKAPDACWRRERLKPQQPDTPESERDRRRPRFRHELASALAILELLRRARGNHPAFERDVLREAKMHVDDSHADVPKAADPLVGELAQLGAADFDLLLYLVSAHHGKVRMSLRSAPDDSREDLPDPCPADKRQARGVRDGDALPPVALPGSNSAACAIISMPAITLDLSPMELGLSPRYGRSWRERTQALLETHGPFRLAWYETLLRIADARASRQLSPAPVAIATPYPPPQEAYAPESLRDQTWATAEYQQSHQCLDDLTLAYFRAIANKIRRDPSLLQIPLENIARWRQQGNVSPGSERGIRIWEDLIRQGDLEALTKLMSDPGEAGARWRQYPVFVGILTREESAAIRRQHET